MKIVSAGTPNNDGEFTFKIETPISKLVFDLDNFNDDYLVPDLFLRSTQFTPKVSITHYSKKSNEQLLANDIPLTVLASYSQYEEGAMQFYARIPPNGYPEDNYSIIYLNRMIANVDLTPKQGEYPEAPSLIFDNDEYIEVTISNLPSTVNINIYGKQTDYRSIVALKYNTISVPSGTLTDYKKISKISDILIPASSFAKTDLYKMTLFDPVTNFGDGDKFKKIRLKHDSGYDVTMHPIELFAHSLDTNDVAAYIDGQLDGVRSSSSVPAVLTHHVLPVSGAKELYIDTYDGLMKYYTVQPIPVSTLSGMETINFSEDLATTALADTIVNEVEEEQN